MGKFGSFILGIVVGVAVTIAVAIIFAYFKTNSAPNTIQNIDGATFFKEPQGTINSKKFQVLQVVTQDAALATAQEHGMFIGTIVLLIGEPNSFYDEQIVTVPAGKAARQIGTYRYQTRMEIVKTVPIVKFLE